MHDDDVAQGEILFIGAFSLLQFELEACNTNLKQNLLERMWNALIGFTVSRPCMYLAKSMMPTQD